MILDMTTSKPFSTNPITKSISGEDIFEGNEVLVFPVTYKVLEKLDDDIYVVDSSRPNPIPDTPYAKGIVEWNPEMLWYQVRLNWACEAWSDPMPVTVAMGRYAFDIVH